MQSLEQYLDDRLAHGRSYFSREEALKALSIVPRNLAAAATRLANPRHDSPLLTSSRRQAHRSARSCAANRSVSTKAPWSDQRQVEQDLIICAAVSDEFRSLCVRAGTQEDAGNHRFTATGLGRSDDGGFAHRELSVQSVLHLPGHI